MAIVRRRNLLIYTFLLILLQAIVYLYTKEKRLTFHGHVKLWSCEPNRIDTVQMKKAITLKRSILQNGTR